MNEQAPTKHSMATAIAITIAIAIAFGLGIVTGHVTTKQKVQTTQPANVIPTAATGVTLSSVSMSPSFAINVSDSSANHETIQVLKGAKVTLTFNTSGIAHSLDFRSTDPVLDSGDITSGGSKSVNFTADKTFSLQSYDSNGKQNNYAIKVVVQ